MKSTFLTASLLTASTLAFPLALQNENANAMAEGAYCPGSLVSIFLPFLSSSSCNDAKKAATSSTSVPTPLDQDDLNDLNDPDTTPYYNPGGFTPVTGAGVFGSLPLFQAQDGDAVPEYPEEEGPNESGEAAWPNPALQQPQPVQVPQPGAQQPYYPVPQPQYQPPYQPTYQPPPTAPAPQPKPTTRPRPSRPSEDEDEDDGWNFGWEDDNEDDDKLA